MPAPEITCKFTLEDGPEGQPIITAKGVGYDGPFEETFECRARIPAKALHTVDVVMFGNTKMPVTDIAEAIANLLITRKWEETTVPGADGEPPTTSGEWVAADDTDRWRTLINDDDDREVAGEDIGDLYSGLIEAYNKRPTSRSRR